MDTAFCGRSELTFEFELFAIGVSVPGLFLLFLFFVWQLSYSATSVC